MKSHFVIKLVYKKPLTVCRLYRAGRIVFPEPQKIIAGKHTFTIKENFFKTNSFHQEIILLRVLSFIRFKKQLIKCMRIRMQLRLAK